MSEKDSAIIINDFIVESEARVRSEIAEKFPKNQHALIYNRVAFLFQMQLSYLVNKTIPCFGTQQSEQKE